MDPITIAMLVSAGISGLGAILPWFSKSYRKSATGSGLTDAQKEQNAFNETQAQDQREFEAAQAENAMQFNSQEAQAQREWEERMSNTQYQRAVNDMQQAGINPAMMYGGLNPASGAVGSSAAGSGATGASASGSSPGSPGGVDLSALSLISDFALKKAQINDLNASAANKESQTRQNDAQTKLIDKTVQYYDNLTTAQVEYLQAQSESIYASIHLTNTNIKLGEQQVRNLQKQEENISADTALKRAQELHQQIMNRFQPELNRLESALKSAQTQEAEASAVRSFADAYMTDYTRAYLQQYGYLPGSSTITTAMSGISSVIGGTIGQSLQYLKPTETDKEFLNSVVNGVKTGFRKGYDYFRGKVLPKLDNMEKYMTGHLNSTGKAIYIANQRR